MSTEIQASKLIYGKRDHVNGGWHYSVTELGSAQFPGDLSDAEAELIARKHFPDANRYRVFTVHPDGRRVWWLSSHLN